MELSDEEIKAIEKVKEAIRVDREQRIVTIYDEKPLFRDQLQIIIDLINNQQKEIEEKTTILLAGSKKVKQLEKEIEELKEKNTQLTNYLNDSYYVSADEIKEKLKELEEQKEKLKYDGNRSFADYEQFCKNLKFFKEQIEELLEEN